jgi:tetratricopeptide (TPR) repeat protein
LETVHNDSLATSYIEKAVALDTVPAKKLEYIKSTAESLRASKKYAQAGKWYTKILSMKPDYGKIDLYYAGYNDYRGGDYKGADSIFGLYELKYPDDAFGPYMKAHAEEGIDTSNVLGLAKADYEKVIAINDTTTDSTRLKAYKVTAYRYLVAYHYNIKHDKDSALYFNSKILELDPNDAQALANDKALRALPSQPSQPAKASKDSGSPPKK